MSLNFQELDHADSPYGELILRRRRVLSMDGAEFYEVKLDGEFLMSSMVNQSEIALAELGLAALGHGPWDVVIGGLGLGYTAAAALDQTGVRSVLVVEALAEVIGWHERELVPLGKQVTSDPRCRIVHADFFARARDTAVGFDAEAPGRLYDALLLDIDHSPKDLLHGAHADFYEPPGLRRAAAHLRPGGVFALWSSEPPDDAFTARLDQAFASTEAHAVDFYNPLLDRDDTNTVYVCRTAGA
ncbi:MAG: polyamine aminopropyltransferase [Planctomycetota bacterium]